MQFPIHSRDIPVPPDFFIHRNFISNIHVKNERWHFLLDLFVPEFSSEASTGFGIENILEELLKTKEQGFS